MEKKHSQFRQQKLQKTKPIPYVRYNKKTDEWIMTSKLVKIKKESNIKINKKQLNSIAKIVSYLYFDEKEKYMKSASNSRKQHIYNDLKDIDSWLSIQYKRLKEKDEEKCKSK